MNWIISLLKIWYKFRGFKLFWFWRIVTDKIPIFLKKHRISWKNFPFSEKSNYWEKLTLSSILIRGIWHLRMMTSKILKVHHSTYVLLVASPTFWNKNKDFGSQVHLAYTNLKESISIWMTLNKNPTFCCSVQPNFVWSLLRKIDQYKFSRQNNTYRTHSL